MATANESKRAGQSGDGLNFLIFSEIAFNAKHTFTIVKYLLVCGEHCDSGATLVMKKLTVAGPRVQDDPALCSLTDSANS